MLKLIAGKKGSGKTKQLIAMVNDAASTTSGKVVCIEKGNKLTYDINHDVRLFNIDDYKVSGFEAFYGFLAGIAASDYDVKQIFVDGVTRIIGNSGEKFVEFFDKVEEICSNGDLDIIMTVSSDPKELPEPVGKYVSLSLA